MKTTDAIAHLGLGSLPHDAETVIDAICFVRYMDDQGRICWAVRETDELSVFEGLGILGAEHARRTTGYAANFLTDDGGD